MAGLVQYYVMKRPKHPVTGEIIRGKFAGATRNVDNSINKGATLWFPKNETSIQPNGTLMSTTEPLAAVGTGPDATDLAQVDGEPWLLHSVHFSIDEAVKAALPVISTVGSENTRILQVIAHEVFVKLA